MTLHRPKIGMKVRIIGTYSAKEYDGNNRLVMDYDKDLCDTGTLVDITAMVLRAHSPKLYTVKLDSPNIGEMLVLGTDTLEPA